jgi:peptidyl-prolyl cis-trans isomerase D
MTAQKKTTKQILVKVSLGIVLTVSTIGFIFSDFQSFSLQGDTNIVRTVNDIPIKTSDITQEREGMARLLGAIPQDAVLRQQIIDQAFENITLRTVISSYTDIQGILASENEVAKIIHSIPVFHGADGQFDGMLFKNLLQSQGVSVKQFKYNIAQNIARESFTTPIATEFPLSQKIIKSFNDFLFTTIDFTAYHIDYNKLTQN